MDDANWRRQSLEEVIMVARIDPVAVLHIRFEGRSFDIPLSDLDVGTLSIDAEVKRALAGYLNALPAANESKRFHFSCRNGVCFGAK
jgi:hypothetical protein